MKLIDKDDLDLSSATNEKSWQRRLKVPPQFIISYKNQVKKWWDILVLVLAVWNAFFMPFDYAFVIPDTVVFVRTFDLLVDVIFCFDIILMFLTTYLSKDGQEISDNFRIASQYTSSLRFYTDFFSLLGINIFAQLSKRLKIFGLLKILRVFRINDFIRKLTVKAE